MFKRERVQFILTFNRSKRERKFVRDEENKVKKKLEIGYLYNLFKSLFMTFC